MSRILIPLLLLGVGCARVVPLRSDAEIDALNRQGAEQFAVVTLENGKSLSAHRLELRADTLRIHHFQPIPADVHPLSDIRSIRFANNREGALRGARIGGLTFLGATTVFVLASGWLTQSPSEPFGLLVLLLGVTAPVYGAYIGMGLGGATGFLVGEPCRYVPAPDTLAVPDSLFIPASVVP